ncbi:hypothetical protein GGD56_005540 [Rhizobium mongolense]|uniref:Uncharacterized protein n=1 Tax=Rhizobium mongolense TaxID=57676 RepID=A0ABR6IUS9_9HYPH|nr:hypothetical protein [Rhizobium mongolense]
MNEFALGAMPVGCGFIVLSQHFCIRGSVYKSLSREFKTPMLAHGSQTQLPRLCVKLAPLFGPTVFQTFQCSIRP